MKARRNTPAASTGMSPSSISAPIWWTARTPSSSNTAPNLINAVLTEGILVESEDYNGWWNNDVKYLSYGPAQAVIVPYCEEAI